MNLSSVIRSAFHPPMAKFMAVHSLRVWKFSSLGRAVLYIPLSGIDSTSNESALEIAARRNSVSS